MGIVLREGFDFGFDPGACTACPGRCCCGESGYIWVNQQEILQISCFLKINSIDFIEKYLDRIGNRFSIKERITEHDFECVFFDGAKRHCSIYAVRPLQCIRYPFWNRFRRHKDQVIKECPGII